MKDVPPPSSATAKNPEDSSPVGAVRLGSGANCSSVGSMVDALFLTAVTGSALAAALLAAIKKGADVEAGNVTPSHDVEHTLGEENRTPSERP